MVITQSRLLFLLTCLKQCKPGKQLKHRHKHYQKKNYHCCNNRVRDILLILDPQARVEKEYPYAVEQMKKHTQQQDHLKRQHIRRMHEAHDSVKPLFTQIQKEQGRGENQKIRNKSNTGYHVQIPECHADMFSVAVGDFHTYE